MNQQNNDNKQKEIEVTSQNFFQRTEVLGVLIAFYIRQKYYSKKHSLVFIKGRFWPTRG